MQYNCLPLSAKTILSITENDQIEFEDFRYLMKIIRRDSVRKEDEEKTLQRAFKLFDKDGSGTIDKSELERITTQMGESLSKDELEQMLRLVDTNKDGKIDYNGMIEIFNVDYGYSLLLRVTVMIMIIWQLDLQLPMQSVPSTTNVVSSNPVHGKVYLIQHDVIKFVSDLRQVSGFL